MAYVLIILVPGIVLAFVAVVSTIDSGEPPGFGRGPRKSLWRRLRRIKPAATAS